jgi:hypothetical protein
MDLREELSRLVDLLEREGVDYALCGGLAVAFHGYARFTKDIDLLVERGDIERITELVRQLDFTVSTGPMPFGVGTDHPREVHRISKLGDDEVLTLDLVVVTPALEQVWSDRELFEWQDRRIKVVSAEGLATMKRLAGRDQDLLDLKMLGFERDDDAQDDDT